MSSLQILERPILTGRGACHESDVFSVLWHTSSVVRAFEFAMADGAIDCSKESPEGTSFAERLWSLDQELRLWPESHRILLFDVKSSTYPTSDRQLYTTNKFQQSQVAFYLGFSASNPRHVELIPNVYQQDPAATRLAHEEGSQPSNVDKLRISTVDPLTYGCLAPHRAPFRMPLALLPEAIRRVRRCVQTQQPYTNPWTKVCFSQWTPRTTTSILHLKPLEETPHFTAYMAVEAIYRALKVAPCSIGLDLMALQPRVADFKLIVPPSPAYPTGRQVFVQHKIDTVNRHLPGALSRVPMGRTGERLSWYFDAACR